MSEKSAFLFYSSDFLTGTLALPMEDRGKYITLLCYMHAHGRMEEEAVYNLIGEISKQLRAKFKTDENGSWYNKRLEKEIRKRDRFVASRRSNGNKGGRPKKMASQPSQGELSSISAGKNDEQIKDIIPSGEATKNNLENSHSTVWEIPKPEQVKAFFMGRGLSAIDAEYETLKFMAHYMGTGWKTAGGTNILDWKAFVVKWLIKRNQFHNYKQPKTLTEQWLG